jgi:hypothetical protein
LVRKQLLLYASLGLGAMDIIRFLEKNVLARIKKRFVTFTSEPVGVVSAEATPDRTTGARQPR